MDVHGLSKSSQIPLFALVQPKADGKLRVQLARVPLDGSCGGMRHAACGAGDRQWHFRSPRFRNSAIQHPIRFGAEQQDAKLGQLLKANSRPYTVCVELEREGLVRLKRGSATSAPLAALQPLAARNPPAAHQPQHRTPTRTRCIAASVRAPKVASADLAGSLRAVLGPD